MKSFRVNSANSSSRRRSAPLLPFFFGEALADASRHAEGGVDLPAAKHADDVHSLAPGFDHLGCRSQRPPCGSRPGCSSLPRGRRDPSRSRAAQDIEVHRVVGHVKGGVKKLPSFFAAGGGGSTWKTSSVAFIAARWRASGTDAADAGCNVGQFFDPPPLGEFLETPKLEDDHIGIGHIPWSSRKRSILPCPSSRVTG